MKPVGNVSVRRRSAAGLEVEGRAGMMPSSIIWRPAALVALSYRPAFSLPAPRSRTPLLDAETRRERPDLSNPGPLEDRTLVGILQVVRVSVMTTRR